MMGALRQAADMRSFGSNFPSRRTSARHPLRRSDRGVLRPRPIDRNLGWGGSLTIPIQRFGRMKAAPVWLTDLKSKGEGGYFR